MGEVVPIAMNVAQPLVVLFAVGKVLDEVIADTKTGRFADAPYFNCANMKRRG